MRIPSIAAAVAAILIAQIASAGNRWSSRPSAGPTAEEALVQSWVDAHLGPNEPLAAVGNGQRIGYYARRPTVAVPSPFFTARPWDVAALSETVRRYAIRVVVWTPAADPRLFARGVPTWLTPALESSQVRIFRVSEDSVPTRQNAPGNPARR